MTRAVEAGRQANVPVMIDFGGNDPPQSLDDLLNTHLRPGDILTHMYAHVRGRHPIVNAQGQIEPYVLAARKRGVIFDVGHGGGSFLFRQAVPATKQGFYPGRDQHRPAHGQHEHRDEGHPERDVEAAEPRDAAAATRFARARRSPRRSSSVRNSDTSGWAPRPTSRCWRVRKGEFGFIDSGGSRMPGTQKLECEMTVKGGQVVWDLNGRSHTLWSAQ